MNSLELLACRSSRSSNPVKDSECEERHSDLDLEGSKERWRFTRHPLQCGPPLLGCQRHPERVLEEVRPSQLTAPSLIADSNTVFLRSEDQLFLQLKSVFFAVALRCNRRDVDTTRFKVEDLREGDEYEFRVQAYNEAGPSRPSTTAGPIIIQDQSCKTRTKQTTCSEL